MIFSRNGAVYSTTVEDYQLLPDAHAECRALKKMDWGGELYVARVRRKDRTIAMASPCEMCRIKIRARGVVKVYYTINETQYGVWLVKKDTDRIINCGK